MARFQARVAPPAEWQEMEALASACERSGLSVHQAAVARLGALGFSYSDIAATLELDTTLSARRVARHAALKLKSSEAEFIRQRVTDRRDLLRVMRAGPLPDERETWGVTPSHQMVTHLPAAVPFGEVAQDCMPDAVRTPLRFIRALSVLLAEAVTLA